MTCSCVCTCGAKVVYTVLKGEITQSDFIKDTKKGYRVVGGRKPFDHVVYKERQLKGWDNEAEKLFYLERSFFSEEEAREFANKQLLSMEHYHLDKLAEIIRLKESNQPPEGAIEPLSLLFAHYGESTLEVSSDFDVVEFQKGVSELHRIMRCENV